MPQGTPLACGRPEPVTCHPYRRSGMLDSGSDDAQRGFAGWGVFPRFDRRLVSNTSTELPPHAGVSQTR